MYRVLYFLSFFSLVALAAGRVVIDGNLDEPEWENAFITDKFYQTSPYNLEEAKKLKVEEKSCFNHVGIKKFDEKEKIKLIIKERYHYKNFNPKIEDMFLFLDYFF